MMKRRLYFLLAIVLLWGCGRQDPGRDQDGIVAVKLTPLEREDVVIPYHAVGIIASEKTVKLGFKIGGILRELNVQGGERVLRGQVLGRLDLSEIDAHYRKAMEALEKSSRDFSRAERLYSEGIITTELYENARTALEVARADSSLAAFNRKHAEIRAPSDGVIMKCLFEEGELVAPGMPVMVFGSTEENWVIRVGISDRDMIRTSIGDTALIMVDAYPSAEYRARVTRINEVPEPETGLFELEAQFSETPPRLSTGMIGRIIIFPSSPVSHLVIPIAALVEAEGSEGFIYTLSSDSRAVKNHVEIIAILDGRVAISTSLPEQSGIVSSGAPYLQEGSRIQVISQ
ncbi:efflux RND transporter periplasmic adaptor subunit [bacterium]|nr:efflux RND transporter periplasmic adaptor subunit [bacterium]